MVILRFLQRYPWTISIAIVFVCLGWLTKSQSEFCSVSHGIDVTNTVTLTKTYDYLGKLDKMELDQTLNRFVIANLPLQEKDVRVRRTPGVCSVFGKHPPVIPPRPERVDKLYKVWSSQKVSRVKSR